jgi:hypothetical protein
MFERDWFMSLDDARRKCEARRRDYNVERPHSAIGNKAPVELTGQQHTARADRTRLEKGQQTGPRLGEQFRRKRSQADRGPKNPGRSMWTLAYGQHRDRTPTHGYQATRARGRDAPDVVGGRSALLYTLRGLASSDMRLIVAASSMKRLFSMMTHGWFGALMIVLMQSMRTG